MEPSHLDFHCLQTYVRVYLMSEVTRLYHIVLPSLIGARQHNNDLFGHCWSKQYPAYFKSL